MPARRRGKSKRRAERHSFGCRCYSKSTTYIDPTCIWATKRLLA